jgi:hypothetical protein
MSEQVKVLAGVKRAEGLPERVIGAIGDDADGVLVAAERGANGRFHLITPKVDFERACNYAESVLAGEARALTWPDGLMVLAIALAGVRLALEDAKRERDSAAAGTTAAADPAEAVSPPPAASAGSYREASRGR